LATSINGMVNSDEYMIPAVNDVKTAMVVLLVRASKSIPKLYIIWLNM
jgi:hypothetical protein